MGEFNIIFCFFLPIRSSHASRLSDCLLALDCVFSRVATMSDEVYRLLLVSAYMVQLTLVSFVPYIGTPLVWIHLCWLYSLYSFEYKWSLLGWSLEYRLKYFEKHW